MTGLTMMFSIKRLLFCNNRPNEDLVMHLKGFVVYAYNDVAGILSMMNVYIPFKSQPRDLKIQTSIAPSSFHFKSLSLRIVSLVVRPVLV